MCIILIAKPCDAYQLMIPLVLFPCWFIRSVQHLLEKHPWQLLSIDFTLSLGIHSQV